MGLAAYPLFFCPFLSKFQDLHLDENVCSYYNNHIRTAKGVLYLNLISEFIANFSGKTVIACIFHKIYGDQKATIHEFHPFYAKDRVGFIVNGREVFVYFDEIENVNYNKNTFIINGSLQKMVVKLV